MDKVLNLSLHLVLCLPYLLQLSGLTDNNVLMFSFCQGCWLVVGSTLNKAHRGIHTQELCGLSIFPRVPRVSICVYVCVCLFLLEYLECVYVWIALSVCLFLLECLECVCLFVCLYIHLYVYPTLNSHPLQLVLWQDSTQGGWEAINGTREPSGHLPDPHVRADQSRVFSQHKGEWSTCCLYVVDTELCL